MGEKEIYDEVNFEGAESIWFTRSWMCGDIYHGGHKSVSLIRKKYIYDVNIY